MQEPAIVGDGDEKISAVKNEMTRKFADSILETDERRNAAAVMRELKDAKLVSAIEIFRHLVTDNRGEKGERVTKGNIFTKRDEMNFAVKLRFARRTKKQGRIVNALRLFLDRTKQ